MRGSPPLALYLGLISNATVYAAANGGQYPFLLDEQFALPLHPEAASGMGPSVAPHSSSQAFFNDLLRNASSELGAPSTPTS